MEQLVIFDAKLSHRSSSQHMEINFDIKEDCLPYFSFVVKTGSCEETELNNGISHLIEHLTVSNITCSPSKIASDLYVDAVTKKEYTYFFFSTINEQILIERFKQIFDLVFNSNHISKNLNYEREIVINEIHNRKTFSQIKERFNSLVFYDTSFSLPTCGSIDALNKLTASNIENFYSEKYSTNKNTRVFTNNYELYNTIKLMSANINHTIQDGFYIDYKPKSLTISGELPYGNIVMAGTLVDNALVKKSALIYLSFLLFGPDGLFNLLLRNELGIYTLQPILDVYVQSSVWGLGVSIPQKKCQKFVSLLENFFRELTEDQDRLCKLSSNYLNKFFIYQHIKNRNYLDRVISLNEGTLINQHCLEGVHKRFMSTIDVLRYGTWCCLSIGDLNHNDIINAIMHNI